jgi:c(7)-type cytochrome triheme protein
VAGTVRITFWRAVAGLVIVAGLWATVLRFGQGLGASTNLSDSVPWGLWIGFDVLVGVGLAAGGFTITAAVHLFDLKRYRPIVRPTILTAFFGYLLVIVGLLFDLGQPQRVWHPLIMWNSHSAMFEIAWCVTLYTTVLFLEFSPMLLEKLRWQRALRAVRTITIPVVILGVLLSTLHQSSLGTLFVIVPNKLHGLWYSPFLPVFFFLSAIAAGLAMIIIESSLSARAFGRRLELPILSEVARIIPVVLALYLVVKVQDMMHRDAFPLLLNGDPEGYLFLVEMVFGGVVPMILLFVPAVRRDASCLVSAALLVVLGFVLGRLNVSITGMQRALGGDYFPAWSELAVTGMLICFGFIGFSMAVRYLKVFPEVESEPAQVPMRPSPLAQWLTRGSVGGLAIVLLYGLLVFQQGEAAAQTPVSIAPVVSRSSTPELILPDLVVYEAPDMGPVEFSHDTHVEVAEPSCQICHDGNLPLVPDILAPAPRIRGEDRLHEMCGRCHNGEHAFAVEDGCEDCHLE